jgi:hypothetical protein
MPTNESPVPDAEAMLRERMDTLAAQHLRKVLAGRRGAEAPTLDTLVNGVPGLLQEAPELAWVAEAALLYDEDLTDPDTESLLEVIAATIAPSNVASEAAEAVDALDHIPLLSVIASLVIEGPGADAAPARLLARVEEVADSPTGPDDAAALDRALTYILPVWRAVGVLDEVGRLTPEGAWLLPRGACLAWDSDFDDPESLDGPGRWEELYGEEPPELDEPEQALVDAVVARLAVAGALSVADLAADVGRVVGETLDAEELEDLLRMIPDFMPLRDWRLVHLPSLADGVVLTRRVSEVEIELGALLVHPDLAVLAWLDGDLRLAGGGHAGVRVRRGHPMGIGTALVGPEGWLGETAAGDLVTLRIAGGEVTVEPVTEDALHTDTAELTVRCLCEAYEHLDGVNAFGGPLDAPELLLEVLASAPLTFAVPQAPLSELLERAGIDVDTDWDELDHIEHLADELDDLDDLDDLDELDELDGPDEWDHAEERADYLTEIYGFGEAGVQAHELLLGVIRLVAEEGLESLEDAELDDLTDLVGEVAVTESIADAAARFSSRDLGALRELSVALHERARGRARAGCAYLRARTAEHLGFTEEGEALLGEAIDADPSCRPALLDAAWYAEDRGDAGRGLSLLRRAAVPPDDPQARRLEAVAAPAVTAKVGRNDPCPCGSGRKYKVCCQRGGGRRPLAERAGWLLDKAGTYAHRPMNRARLLPLVEARAGDPTDLERVAAAMRDPLLQDLGLFEEELLDDFLDDRGGLLPADELELGRAWAGTPRSLYEIVEVQPEEALVLLDLRTGARVRVVERTGTRTMRAGGAILARVLPVAEHHVLAAGPVRIDVQHREAILGLLDTDPTGPEIAAWVAALEAPPRLVTMEGEATVFCSAAFEVTDPDAARSALDDRYTPVGDDAWIEQVDTPTGRWTRGTLHLAGSRLEVQTNAVARHKRLLATIAEMLPEARLVDDERRDLPQVGGPSGGGGGPGLGGPVGAGGSGGVAGEETEAVLARFVREHEDRWVDERVPALGGLTPREAAADPTRREQLLALLDEMDAIRVPPPGRGMDVGRLRKLLDL